MTTTAPVFSASKTVRRFRQDRGWSQRQAAAWYGVTLRSWQRYESEERSVPQPLLNRITSYEVALAIADS